MVKTDYKPGDYIWGTFNGGTVRLITACRIKFDDLTWSETNDKNLDHCWELKNIRLATKKEIIAAGFKLKKNNYELW